jgi:hypothetical protein
MQIDPAKTAIVCNISAWGDSLFDSVPRAAEGICGEVHTVLPDENTAGIEKVKALAKWAGRDTETLTTNYIYGMIGSFILETAIRRALEKHGYEKVVQSGDAIRDEIHNFKAADPFGLSKPPEVLYPDRPYLMNYSQIVEAKDGKFVKTGDWILIDRIEGAM